jgi:hypothetical protein
MQQKVSDSILDDEDDIPVHTETIPTEDITVAYSYLHLLRCALFSKTLVLSAPLILNAHIRC